MHILAFDEYGSFENVNDEQTKYIAGVLYTGSQYDTEVERKRILAYLQDACSNASADFPGDLHQNHQHSNWNQVADVEKELKHTIAEFIKEGTAHGVSLKDANGAEFGPRKGYYDIIAIIKSNAGKQELLKLGTDPIVNDLVASNLYVHMAEDLLTTLLFHNPLVGELRDVRLELASRSIPASALSREKKNEFRNIGIGDAGDGYQILYRAANTDTYRTVIQREMQRIGKVDQDITLEVLPINYSNANTKMAFLYLADFICGFLHNKPKATDGVRITYAYNKALEYTGREPLIFGYDAVDVQFSKAWQYLEMGMFYEALDMAYEACCGEEAFARFYYDHWLPCVEKAIMQQDDSYSLRVAVRKLESATYATVIDQDKLLFIFSALERCCIHANAARKDSRMMYKLYNSGIAAFNHIGDPANARACFDKGLSYVDGAYVDEFIRTRNRLTVSYCDGFLFDKAEEIVRDTIVYAELLRENRSMVFKTEESSDILCGITQSQCGQVLAYMRDGEAEGHFLKALNEMEKGSANYYISLSYLLHHYIDMNDKPKYEQYAVGYFGNKNSLQAQYDYLCNPASPMNAKYALYVYVKAVWTFYRGSVPESVRAAFADISADFEKRGLDHLMGGDPWELIYKYLLLFSKEWQDYKGEKRYLKLLEAPIGEYEGKMVRFTRQYGLIQYYEMCGNRSVMIQRARKLYEEMVECGYLEEIPASNGDRIMELLKGKFTYMNV